MSALLGEMAEVIESVDEDLSRALATEINDLSDELEDLEADLYEDEDEDGESEDAEDEDSDGDDDDGCCDEHTRQRAAQGSGLP